MGDAPAEESRDAIIHQLAETNQLLRELVDVTRDAEATVEDAVARERKSRRFWTVVLTALVLVVTAVGAVMVLDLRSGQAAACEDRERIVRVVEVIAMEATGSPAERERYADLALQAAGGC